MGWPWGRGNDQDELRTRVAELESYNRRLRAEWADILDRLLRLDERQRKRQERAEAPTDTPDTPAARKRALRLRLASQGTHNGTRS